MNDLPPGWEWTTINEVAATSLGKMLDKKQATGLHPTPYLRNINVRWGSFDLADLAEMDIRLEELDRVLARPGDVIACEGGEPGRTAVWRGPGTIALQKALHRIQPTDAILPDYLAYLLQHLAVSRRLEPLFTGTTIKHLPQEKLRLVPVPLPPRAEQERIVAAIEEHLSRLDAAHNLVKSVMSRLAVLRSASLKSLLSEEWPLRPLGDLTINFDGRRVPLKRTDREGRPGPYPYYGASGVIDSIDGYLFDGEFLLIPEDGANLASRSKPIAFSASGRFWVNNHAHVVQPVHGVESRYLELVVNASDIQRLITGSAQPKLTQANLNRIEVPVPSLQDQLAVVTEHDRAASLTDRLQAVLCHVEAEGQSLRRSILAAAFSGQLVPHDPSDEPASVLLERIRAERAALPPTKKARRATAS